MKGLQAYRPYLPSARFSIFTGLEKGTRPLAVMSEKVSEECRKQQSELYKTVTISLKCSEATLKTAQV